jgi:hypothetical protein
MPEYAYSTNDEDFTGGFASPETALQEGFHENQDDPDTSITVGKCVPPPCAELLYADLLLEHIVCQEEYQGEYAEGVFDGIPDDVKQELTDNLRLLFESWLTKHDLRPKFFVIEETERWSRERAVSVGIIEALPLE